ncbi:MAG: glycine C-acetyltransferase [Myxococcota bacterium]
MSNDRFQFVKDAIKDLKERGVFRKLKVIMDRQGAVCNIDGKKVINLSSNNYLGLTNHPKMVKASIEAIKKYGVGAGAVRTIIGTLKIHEELEKRLAKFKGVEAALVFQSGFCANQGVIGTLLNEGDLAISDELNHASIIDGLRLTKATRMIYKHADMNDLEERLKEGVKQGFKKIMIITDGVFSMDGDVAPLDRIYELAKKYNAITMVDDAHGSGVMGEGRGTVHHFGLNKVWDIQMGTLSKAVGCMGGYIATHKDIRILMEHRARPFLFSTSHPPAVAASCIAAIEVLSSQEGKRLVKRLWDNAKYFKDSLNQLGFNTGNSQTPITPVIVGEGALAMKLSDELFKEGVFAQGIAFPTVPRDKARVRTIVTANHTKRDLDIALDKFEKVGKKLRII